MRDPGAQDERQPGSLDRHLIGLGDHSRIGHHSDLSQPVGGHERFDHRQHRGGLGPIALREPGRVGQQTDGDLRFQATFLGKPRFAESVTGISLEVQRAHVIEHQRRRAQPGGAGARRRQRVAQRGLGEHRQATRNSSVRDRLDTGLSKHPQRVLLAGRLDDPGQHQIPEHLVTPDRTVKPEQVIDPAQSVPQMPRTRTDDFQWPASDLGRIQSEVECALALDQPLPGRSLERLQLRLVVGRPQMLNAARTPP
jgi:hypothetical protein